MPILSGQSKPLGAWRAISSGPAELISQEQSVWWTTLCRCHWESHLFQFCKMVHLRFFQWETQVEKPLYFHPETRQILETSQPTTLFCGHFGADGSSQEEHWKTKMCHLTSLIATAFWRQARTRKSGSLNISNSLDLAVCLLMSVITLCCVPF